jgi:pSer/pThr/pTyr-binding forkhead associated (FHA) protein
MSGGSTTRKFSGTTTGNDLAFLARYECAIVLLTEPAAGSEYPLLAGRTILGRGPDVDLVFEDDHLSRQHVAFELTSEGFQVLDLGSTNGILVNDQPVDAVLLQHGDRIALGQLTFQYVVQERSDQNEFDLSDS